MLVNVPGLPKLELRILLHLLKFHFLRKGVQEKSIVNIFLMLCLLVSLLSAIVCLISGSVLNSIRNQFLII